MHAVNSDSLLMIKQVQSLFNPDFSYEVRRSECEETLQGDADDEEPFEAQVPTQAKHLKSDRKPVPRARYDTSRRRQPGEQAKWRHGCFDTRRCLKQSQ